MDHTRGDEAGKHCATWWLVGEGHLTRFGYYRDRRNIASIISEKSFEAVKLLLKRHNKQETERVSLQFACGFMINLSMSEDLRCGFSMLVRTRIKQKKLRNHGVQRYLKVTGRCRFSFRIAQIFFFLSQLNEKG